MVREGHFVGSHTFSHLRANSVPQTPAGAALLRSELDATNAALMRAVGLNATHLRMPYGDCNTFVRQTVEALGYRLVFWNLDSVRPFSRPSSFRLLSPVHAPRCSSLDRPLLRVTRPAAQLDFEGDLRTLSEAIDSAMDGFDPRVTSFILLMHLSHPVGLCALPALIDRIRARGYQFVSAEQCFDSTRAALPPPTSSAAHTDTDSEFEGDSDGEEGGRSGGVVIRRVSNETRAQCVHPILSRAHPHLTRSLPPHCTRADAVLCVRRGL
jgi:peptidoglycan/xylan/chitin deacetylase (PgdA/CDA1 family)